MKKTLSLHDLLYETYGKKYPDIQSKFESFIKTNNGTLFLTNLCKYSKSFYDQAGILKVYAQMHIIKDLKKYDTEAITSLYKDYCLSVFSLYGHQVIIDEQYHYVARASLKNLANTL